MKLSALCYGVDCVQNRPLRLGSSTLRWGRYQPRLLRLLLLLLCRITTKSRTFSVVGRMRTRSDSQSLKAPIHQPDGRAEQILIPSRVLGHLLTLPLPPSSPKPSLPLPPPLLPPHPPFILVPSVQQPTWARLRPSQGITRANRCRREGFLGGRRRRVQDLYRIALDLLLSSMMVSSLTDIPFSYHEKRR
jgi:hypothetical protein